MDISDSTQSPLRSSSSETVGVWQLRRVGPPSSVQNSASLIRLREDGEVTIGRGPTADYFLDSAVTLRLISRIHASIQGERQASGRPKFTIINSGLNGTYINDFKMGFHSENKQLLQEGDKITFGHPGCASIQPGDYAPQSKSEFQFIFECIPASRAKAQEKQYQQQKTHSHSHSVSPKHNHHHHHHHHLNAQAKPVVVPSTDTMGSRLADSPRSNASASEKENCKKENCISAPISVTSEGTSGSAIVNGIIMSPSKIHQVNGCRHQSHQADQKCNNSCKGQIHSPNPKLDSACEHQNHQSNVVLDNCCKHCHHPHHHHHHSPDPKSHNGYRHKKFSPLPKASNECRHQDHSSDLTSDNCCRDQNHLPVPSSDNECKHRHHSPGSNKLQTIKHDSKTAEILSPGSRLVNGSRFCPDKTLPISVCTSEHIVTFPNVKCSPAARKLYAVSPGKVVCENLVSSTNHISSPSGSLSGQTTVSAKQSTSIALHTHAAYSVKSVEVLKNSNEVDSTTINLCDDERDDECNGSKEGDDFKRSPEIDFIGETGPQLPTRIKVEDESEETGSFNKSGESESGSLPSLLPVENISTAFINNTHKSVTPSSSTRFPHSDKPSQPTHKTNSLESMPELILSTSGNTPPNNKTVSVMSHSTQTQSDLSHFASKSPHFHKASPGKKTMPETDCIHDKVSHHSCNGKPVGTSDNGSRQHQQHHQQQQPQRVFSVTSETVFQGAAPLSRHDISKTHHPRQPEKPTAVASSISNTLPSSPSSSSLSSLSSSVSYSSASKKGGTCQVSKQLPIGHKTSQAAELNSTPAVSKHKHSNGWQKNGVVNSHISGKLFPQVSEKETVHPSKFSASQNLKKSANEKLPSPNCAKRDNSSDSSSSSSTSRSSSCSSVHSIPPSSTASHFTSRPASLGSPPPSRASSSGSRSPQRSRPTSATSPQGSEPPLLTSPQRSRPPSLTLPQGSRPPSLTSPQGSRPPSLTSPHGSRPPSLTSPQGSRPPSLTSPQGSGPPSLTSPQGSGPPSLTSPQGSRPPSLTSPQGSRPPSLTSPQGSRPPSLTSPQGSRPTSVTSPQESRPSSGTSSESVPPSRTSQAGSRLSVVTPPQGSRPHSKTSPQRSNPSVSPSGSKSSSRASHSESRPVSANSPPRSRPSSVVNPVVLGTCPPGAVPSPAMSIEVKTTSKTPPPSSRPPSAANPAESRPTSRASPTGSRSSSRSSEKSERNSPPKKIYKDTVPHMYSSSDEGEAFEENKTLEIVKKIYSPARRKHNDDDEKGRSPVSRRSTIFKSQRHGNESVRKGDGPTSQTSTLSTSLSTNVQSNTTNGVTDDEVKRSLFDKERKDSISSPSSPSSSDLSDIENMCQEKSFTTPAEKKMYPDSVKIKTQTFSSTNKSSSSPLSQTTSSSKHVSQPKSSSASTSSSSVTSNHTSNSGHSQSTKTTRAHEQGGKEKLATSFKSAAPTKKVSTAPKKPSQTKTASSIKSSSTSSSSSSSSKSDLLSSKSMTTTTTTPSSKEAPSSEPPTSVNAPSSTPKSSINLSSTTSKPSAGKQAAPASKSMSLSNLPWMDDDFLNPPPNKRQNTKASKKGKNDSSQKNSKSGLANSQTSQSLSNKPSTASKRNGREPSNSESSGAKKRRQSYSSDSSSSDSNVLAFYSGHSKDVKNARQMKQRAAVRKRKMSESEDGAPPKKRAAASRPKRNQEPKGGASKKEDSTERRTGRRASNRVADSKSIGGVTAKGKSKASRGAAKKGKASKSKKKKKKKSLVSDSDSDDDGDDVDHHKNDDDDDDIDIDDIDNDEEDDEDEEEEDEEDDESWDLPDGVQYYDNECNAIKCLNPTGKQVDWVMCDNCEQWYHVVCVDCPVDVVENEDMQFNCGYC